MAASVSEVIESVFKHLNVHNADALQKNEHETVGSELVHCFGTGTCILTHLHKPQ